MAINELDYSRFAFPSDSDWGRCLNDFMKFEYAKSQSYNTLKSYRSDLQAFFSGSANGGPPKIVNTIITWADC